jgi:membrane dipeptidase
MSEDIPYFDGHNDVLLRFYLSKDADPIGAFINGGGAGHIDLPRAREGHLVGGLFAMYSPSREKFNLGDMQGASYDLPLPMALDPAMASAAIIKQLSMLLKLEAAADGKLVICTSAEAVRNAVKREAMAVVLHLEGADAIDTDLNLLHVLHRAGLRSLGPVWSRPTVFGHGVPLRFPSSPDTGPGLTEAGKRLVRECNALRILVDVSHLNEKGFWDVAAISKSPIVATHSNVHSICPSPRNLTDKQLDAIRDSDGFVGLAFATSYLRADGQMRADTEVEWMVRHLDALIERLGETRVGLGSDFDGAVIPEEIGTAAGSQVLFQALRRHGYDEPLLRRIGAENWLSALERIL